MTPRPEHAEKPVSIELALGTRVTIHAFPNEAAFVRDIRRVALAANSDEADEARLRELVESGLRSWYPMVEVRRREALADLTGSEHAWYVIRDGRVGKPRERIDRLHAALEAARENEAIARTVLEHVRASMEDAERPRPGRGARRSAGDDRPGHGGSVVALAADEASSEGAR